LVRPVAVDAHVEHFVVLPEQPFELIGDGSFGRAGEAHDEGVAQKEHALPVRLATGKLVVPVAVAVDFRRAVRDDPVQDIAVEHDPEVHPERIAEGRFDDPGAQEQFQAQQAEEHRDEQHPDAKADSLHPYTPVSVG
jgi:hypothetical protein